MRVVRFARRGRRLDGGDLAEPQVGHRMGDAVDLDQVGRLIGHLIAVHADAGETGDDADDAGAADAAVRCSYRRTSAADAAIGELFGSPCAADAAAGDRGLVRAAHGRGRCFRNGDRRRLLCAGGEQQRQGKRRPAEQPRCRHGCGSGSASSM